MFLDPSSDPAVNLRSDYREALTRSLGSFNLDDEKLEMFVSMPLGELQVHERIAAKACRKQRPAPEAPTLKQEALFIELTALAGKVEGRSGARLKAGKYLDQVVERVNQHRLLLGQTWLEKILSSSDLRKAARAPLANLERALAERQSPCIDSPVGNHLMCFAQGQLVVELEEQFRESRSAAFNNELTNLQEALGPLLHSATRESQRGFCRALASAQMRLAALSERDPEEDQYLVHDFKELTSRLWAEATVLFDNAEADDATAELEVLASGLSIRKTVLEKAADSVPYQEDLQQFLEIFPTIPRHILIENALLYRTEQSFTSAEYLFERPIERIATDRTQSGRLRMIAAGSSFVDFGASQTFI